MTATKLERAPRIGVVGGVNMDIHLFGVSRQLSGADFVADEYLAEPGGKGANQARAASVLGASVTLVARVGDDEFGRLCLEAAQSDGVDTESVRVDVRQRTVRTGITKVGMPGSEIGLQPEDPTIAEMLKPLGYRTEQFGKNHLGDKDVGLGGDGDLANCTVMCLAGDMKTTVAEMGRISRDQVVMVRIDEDTKSDLDDWVETGAVRSRSEAAALFIREGIKFRSRELDQLREALEDVGQAKQRLEEQARQVIGNIPEPTS